MNIQPTKALGHVSDIPRTIAKNVQVFHSHNKMIATAMMIMRT
jgi:hypothetical protein